MISNQQIFTPQSRPLLSILNPSIQAKSSTNFFIIQSSPKITVDDINICSSLIDFQMNKIQVYQAQYQDATIKILYGNLSNQINIENLINTLKIVHSQDCKFQAYFLKNTQQPKELIVILDKQDAFIINDFQSFLNICVQSFKFLQNPQQIKHKISQFLQNKHLIGQEFQTQHEKRLPSLICSNLSAFETLSKVFPIIEQKKLIQTTNKMTINESEVDIKSTCKQHSSTLITPQAQVQSGDKSIIQKASSFMSSKTSQSQSAHIEHFLSQPLIFPQHQQNILFGQNLPSNPYLQINLQKKLHLKPVEKSQKVENFQHLLKNRQGPDDYEMIFNNQTEELKEVYSIAMANVRKERKKSYQALQIVLNENDHQAQGSVPHRFLELFVYRMGLSLQSYMITTHFLSVFPANSILKFINGGLTLCPPQTAQKIIPISNAVPKFCVVQGFCDDTQTIEGGLQKSNNILGNNCIFYCSQSSVTIPQNPCTQQMLSFFGCKLINQGDVFALNNNAQMPYFKMKVGKTYRQDYLLRQGLGGGFYIEFHDKPHIHQPMNQQTGGFLTLCKRNGNSLILSKFKLPYKSLVYTPPQTLHNDGMLIGEFDVAYTKTNNYKTYLFRTDDNNIVDVI